MKLISETTLIYNTKVQGENIKPEFTFNDREQTLSTSSFALGKEEFSVVNDSREIFEKLKLFTSFKLQNKIKL